MNKTHPKEAFIQHYRQHTNSRRIKVNLRSLLPRKRNKTLKVITPLNKNAFSTER